MSEEVLLGHVLVVDDDRGLLAILDGILQKSFQVTQASSGPEALHVLENTAVDLVLLDIMMPVMDGLEVCRVIKSRPDTKDIPVIFLTGSEDEDAEETALDAGAVDFISKPVRPRIVESRVKLHTQNYLYLQFLEKMLNERNTTLEALRAETDALLKSTR
jgi:putative two-component system response regulator